MSERPKRLLLVEDHEELWDFLSRRLSRRGFAVTIAQDGEEGLAKARELQPDLILLDMNLPKIDGWTVAQTLRKEPAFATIPIIALTAHAMSGDRQKTIDAGCTDYHPKPIDFAQLLAQIEQVLGRSRTSD